MYTPFSRGLAWYRYKRLEDEFLKATEYFPFQEKFEEMWSEFFGDLLTKIGNSIDSFFRNMLNDARFDSYPHVSELKGGKRERNINYFRDFFEPLYRLSGVQVKTAYGLTSYGEIHPFEDFINDEQNKIPKWWSAYNHVKHTWFECLEEATLKYTINALAGLFVLNVLHKESQEYLVRYQDVIVWDFMESTNTKVILDTLEKSMIGIPKSWRNYHFLARTPLFTHAFRLDDKVSTEDVHERYPT